MGNSKDARYDWHLSSKGYCCSPSVWVCDPHKSRIVGDESKTTKTIGQHYNYFRDYNPETGRYIESDPIGLQGGLNTYGYVGGSPLDRMDEMGLLIGGGCTYDFATGRTRCSTPTTPIMACGTEEYADDPAAGSRRPPGACEQIDSCQKRCECKHLLRLARGMKRMTSKLELDFCIQKCLQDGDL